MKLEIYRKTYTWQIIREGGFNEDELEGLSEVRIGSAILNQSKQSASEVTFGFIIQMFQILGFQFKKVN